MAKISVKKKDVLTFADQIFDIQSFKLFSDVDVPNLNKNNSQSKSKNYPIINRPITAATDTKDDDVEEIRDQDDSPSDHTVEGALPPHHLQSHSGFRR